MENRGGKREGAGRPLATKTLLTQRINEEITKRVHEQIGPMIDAQIRTVLAEKSNTSALKMLLEYVIGRPKETIELGNVEDKQFKLSVKLDAMLASSIHKIYGHSDQK